MVDGVGSSQAADLQSGRPLPAWGSGGGRRTRWLRSASGVIVMLSVLAMTVTIAAAVALYGFADRSDQHQWGEQRAALRNAVGEFRQLFAGGAIDPRFVRMVEQSARLQGLKFETDPPPGEREMQPVVDAQGRIAGFFTWDQTHPMRATVHRIMPLIGLFAVALVSFAGFALRQLARARADMVASEELAQRAANEDKLTGLPNHAKTLELLDLALAERAADEIVSFALLELDGMADINAQLGVLGADEFIVAMAGDLREALPSDAVCGRVSSDRFAMILTSAVRTDVDAIIRRVFEALARPQWIDRVVRASAHAGFAQAPQHATTRGELVRRAELALRAAGKKGPGAVVTFEHTIDAVSSDRKFIQRELPRALSASEFDLHYQPIVAAQGGRIVGVEALLRWTHPERGAIGPAVFIPVAEQMGLMDTLGTFVLRRALADTKRWSDLYVAVNLSPLQVRDRAVVDTVREALEDSGIAPSRLTLEITEGVLIDNPDEMVKRIDELHKLGVRIALDDFGSGYSNLGYLQRFPLDKLKIDRSFVTALGKSANGGVIIQAIVALGRALGLSVLAEGVETEQQRVLLRLAGCDEMQGFLFAKPASANVIDKLIQGKTARPAEALTA
jgi:diguanylate cyclase (GGDEF)-like protein